MSDTALQKFQFHGRHGELFGLYLKTILLSVLTLGIYSFWGRVNISQYMYRNVTLLDRPFGYHATGKELFIGFLKGLVVMLGVVVVLAVLSRLGGKTVAVVLYAGLYIGVLFFLTPWLIVGKWRYWLSRTSWSGLRFRFVGQVAELRSQWVGWMLLTLVTLGLFTPVYMNRLQKFFTDNIRFGNMPFSYDGVSKEMFFLYLKGMLLSIVTVGIYYPWFLVALNRYIIDHTRLDGKPLATRMTGGGMFKLLLTNMLLVVFTLGIGIPVAMNRQMGYFFNNLDAEIDPAALDAVIASPDFGANANASGLEQAADVVDVLSGAL
jgi:uncharacterized membrane protein YjgN (DUF898 family)